MEVNETKMTNFDVVMKLIGPVSPVGDEHIDAERLDNLKRLSILANELLARMEDVSEFGHRQEASMKRAGNYAETYLMSLADSLAY